MGDNDWQEVGGGTGEDLVAWWLVLVLEAKTGL